MEVRVRPVSPLNQIRVGDGGAQLPQARNVDTEAFRVDSTAMRVHAHRDNPASGPATQHSRSSLHTKIHLACDVLDYPLSFILTGANVTDFGQAKPLLVRHLSANSFALMD
jgi:hypothetical protein